ncbi:MAG: alkaline phosphatase family protein [Candidatus Aminicenantales bacterium]
MNRAAKIPLNLKRHLAFLLLWAAGLLLVLSAGPKATGSPGSTAEPAVDYLVLVSLDACRPDYFDLASLPNLTLLFSSGTVYSGAWVCSLESNTPPGHTEISTGTFPRHNGIVGFGWINSETHEVFRPTTLEAINGGAMDRIVAENGVPTLAALIKSRWPAGRVAAVSAEKYYAAQGLGVGPSDFILYSESFTINGVKMLIPAALLGHEPGSQVMADPRLRLPDAAPGDSNVFAVRAALALFKSYKPRALLLNLPATDISGHLTGGIVAPDTMRQVMIATDNALGELVAAYRAEGLLSRTLWVVTADHGMIPNSINIDQDSLRTIARSIGIRQAISVPYTYLDDPSRAGELAEKIAQAHVPGITGAYAKCKAGLAWVYIPAPTTQAALPEDLNRAYMELLSSCVGPIGPDLVVTTQENALLWSGETAPPLNSYGAHGPLTWGNQHIPLALAGPGIRVGLRSDFPARLVDVAPTIARLMGLSSEGMDGLVLADALVIPSYGEVKLQETASLIFMPLRQALIKAFTK